MTTFSKEEYEQLDLVHSGTRFVQTNQCMICKKENEVLNSITYLLPSIISVSNILIFCQKCEKKAQYIYIRECIAAKKLPIAAPLFDPTIEFKVIRTNGDESLGKVETMRNLGWSLTKNEITAWVSLDGSSVIKPLPLSLLFEANPQLLTEFKLKFEYEEMFKREFYDFYKQVQTSIKQLEEKILTLQNQC
jgi:hypothetical protein